MPDLFVSYRYWDMMERRYGVENAVISTEDLDDYGVTRISGLDDVCALESLIEGDVTILYWRRMEEVE